MRDDGEEYEHASFGVQAKRETDPEPVREGVEGERARAERSDRLVGVNLIGSVVTRRSSSTASSASGIRSKSATATTIPPDSAIAVFSSR